jgi:hypothetical protein
MPRMSLAEVRRSELARLLRNTAERVERGESEGSLVDRLQEISGQFGAAHEGLEKVFRLSVDLRSAAFQMGELDPVQREYFAKLEADAKKSPTLRLGDSSTVEVKPWCPREDFPWLCWMECHEVLGGRARILLTREECKQLAAMLLESTEVEEAPCSD